MDNDLAIYIHWPFCKSKCPYCDFYKEVRKDINQDEIIAEYLENLQFYYELTSERRIKSVFFGGGTPSLIEPKNVAKIINFITKKWHIADNIEISLEANPNSDYGNMFIDLKLVGINRLSLGVQALNETDLRFLGRTHTLEQARNCLKKVTQIFDNHSADLIYARPAQKLECWEKELEEICSYGLKHISLYQLTIEENTVFAKKGIKALEDEAAAQMYDFTSEFLASYGYNRYEVSNFAVDGYESRHNLTYWTGGDYLGIGKSAHGRLTLDGNFYATVYPLQHELLTPEDRAEELIIMGLRLSQGIDTAKFTQICGLDFEKFVNVKHLENLITDGFLIKNNNFIYASKKGFPVLNELIRQLCDK
jgi:oxygen-independent coproporphyrinogen-3 oxidase